MAEYQEMMDQEELDILIRRQKVKKRLSSRARIFIQHETPFINKEAEPEYLPGPEY